MCVGVCWRVTKASLETLGIGSVTHGGSQNFWKVNVLTGKWDFFLAFNGNQNYQSPKTQLYRLINANISFLLYCYRFQIKNKQLTAWKTLGMGGGGHNINNKNSTGKIKVRSKMWTDWNSFTSQGRKKNGTLKSQQLWDREQKEP